MDLHRLWRLFGLASLLTICCSSIEAAPNPSRESGSSGKNVPLRWQPGDDSIALCRGGQVLWRFNYATNDSKPSFHPLAPSGGPELTTYRPADHRWHRGLWFSWKYINKVNYWEEDAKTGIAAGRTRWRPPVIQRNPDFSSRIEMDLEYASQNGNAVLTEHRVIQTSAPDSDGGFHLDWNQVFTASDSDVLLDRTPLPNEPEGKAYGGYAGLSVRMLNEASDVVVSTTGGPAVFNPEHRFRGNSKAVDYSFVSDGLTAGLAIFDHNGNLNSPSPWYVINDARFHFFTPAVICFGPHKLKAGEKLALRYRVAVHPGRWTPERLKQDSQKFNKED